MREILMQTGINEKYNVPEVSTIAVMDEVDFNMFVNTLKHNNIGFSFIFGGDIEVENDEMVFEILEQMGFEEE